MILLNPNKLQINFYKASFALLIKWRFKFNLKFNERHKFFFYAFFANMGGPLFAIFFRIKSPMCLQLHVFKNKYFFAMVFVCGIINNMLPRFAAVAATITNNIGNC